MTIVADATVLINFGGGGVLGLLPRLPERRFLVVDEVVEEVRQPPASTATTEAIGSGWLSRHRLGEPMEYVWLARLSTRTPRLGTGELVSIAACAANGWTLATDDRDARRVARELGVETPIPITGSIGLLIAMVDEEILSLVEAESIYREMLARGFRAPFRQLADVLK